MRSLVTSIFRYAYESWTLIAELQSRIQAMEMRCYRKILHISYKDHVTNERVRAKILQAIGPHEDLLMIVKRRKLQWYGHISRSSDLAKTILQDTVKGERRQGRQRKRWEDNIRKWTGLEFGRSQRTVENGKMEKTGCEIICNLKSNLKRKESLSRSNRGPSADQPSALPLGHTGSHTVPDIDSGLFKCLFVPWVFHNVLMGPTACPLNQLS